LLLMSERVAEAGTDTITPSDVYQVVDIVNSELALLHKANNSTPVIDRIAPELAPRQPRHVLQKAREVMLKVQLLRKINDLPESALPPMPLREVRPADVKKMVDLIKQDIVALRPVFGVTESPIPVPRPTGKRPTDVYADLARATAKLDGLGIPSIVPNDVYRVALTIIGDLEIVRRARGLTVPVPMKSGSKDKQPGDVYAKAFELLQALKSLTSENPDFEISGGVVLLNRRSGRIEPGHVMDLLNNILAELSAIKVKVEGGSFTAFAPPQAGKTPSHVYDAVSNALVLAETLE
jgi:hypothetical protein